MRRRGERREGEGGIGDWGRLVGGGYGGWGAPRPLFCCWLGSGAGGLRLPWVSVNLPVRCTYRRRGLRCLWFPRIDRSMLVSLPTSRCSSFLGSLKAEQYLR